MPLNKSVALTAGAVLAAGSLISIAVAQLGPLNPPPGPVADTGPSLADLESGTGLPGGLVEFEVFNVPQLHQFTSNLTGQEIAPGRVYVKSVTVSRGRVTLFDGPGATDSNGVVTSGNVVGRIVQFPASLGSTRETLVVPVNAVVESGLFASWIQGDGFGFLSVTYLPLD